jgi:hypothetical protein
MLLVVGKSLLSSIGTEFFSFRAFIQFIMIDTFPSLIKWFSTINMHPTLPGGLVKTDPWLSSPEILIQWV